jgi:cytidylate kinase
MKLVKLFEEFINEGVHDKNILKAFFMAGGPGSGKSRAAEELFGVPKNGVQSISYRNGLKVINSDQAFELQLKNMGVDPKDLATMDPNKFTELTSGEESPRGKAKRVTDLKQKLYLQGRLGMIIDGTGDDYKKIAAKKGAIEAYGYDCYMIFVNTSLEVALQRNAARSRSLPEELVKEIWQNVQNNIGHFQTIFGGDNIIIVDNSVSGTEHFDKMASAINKLLNKPLQNRIGKEWIKANS